MASPVVDVYVKLPTGRVVSLQLMPGDQVRRIYEHVASEEGVRFEQVQIKYTGKVLQKTHTVQQLGIRAETVLKAEIIRDRTLKIVVKLPSGDDLPLDIHNIDTIGCIKNNIEVKTGILPSEQILKVNGHILNKNTELAWEASIKDNSVLELSLFKKVALSKESSTSQENLEETEINQEDENKKQELLSTFQANNRNVEVVFSFDTTGSMYSCLTQVREQVKETVERLLLDIPNIRIGIIVHGDYCDFDSYVIKVKDLTSDADDLKNFVMDVPSTGGGDSPECYEWVLRKAQQLDWSDESAKALVVIGDDTPHPPSLTDQNVNWHEEVDVLCGMGVKIYGVRAQHNLMSAPFYEELAERSGGVYIQFKQFSLIKDMFLAVCYKESGDEDQLKAFNEEVEKEGRMTEDTKEMFMQMEKMTENESKTTDKEEPISKRYVAQSWWDPSLDNGSPQYTYNANTDTWKTIVNEPERVVHEVSLSPHSRDVSHNSKRKWRLFSCFGGRDNE